MRIPKYKAYVPMWDEVCNVVGIEWGNGLENILTITVAPKRYMYTHKRLSINEVELMECTGLQDKNGIDIYDGHIIDIHQTVNGDNLFVVNINNGILDVLYFRTMKNYQYDIKELLEIDTYVNDKEIEVIGNIYQNKELLEGEN